MKRFAPLGLIAVAIIALTAWGYAVMFATGQKITAWTASYPVGVRGMEFRATALSQGDSREECFGIGMATLVYADGRTLVVPHGVYRDARRPFDLGVSLTIPSDATIGTAKLSVSEAYNCGVFVTRVRSPVLTFQIQ